MLLGILDSFLLALFFYLLYKACGRLNARSVLSLPPGPRRLPIIGSIHHLPLANQHVAFMNWKETYGMSMFTNQTSTSMLPYLTYALRRHCIRTDLQ